MGETMKVFAQVAAALAAATTTTAMSAAQSTSIGTIKYLEDSLEALNREFVSVGAQRTWWYSTGSMRNDRYRDFTVQLTDPGWIAVGADRDTGMVSLTPLENGQPDGWDRDFGARSASLYFTQAGTYTVRLHMERCSESFCFYTIMAGYR